jgi:hypothetical protein
MVSRAHKILAASLGEDAVKKLHISEKSDRSRDAVNIQHKHLPAIRSLLNDDTTNSQRTRSPAVRKLFVDENRLEKVSQRILIFICK